MTREDLFAAIGAVEDSRLAKSEVSVVPPSKSEEETTMKKQKLTPGRIIRNILVAAVIASLLTTTAFAAASYIIFDSPQELLTAVFGDQTGYDHHKGGEVYNEDGRLAAVEPTFDRVPADEGVIAEEIAPQVSPVGQSISWKGYTLTVDAIMYDTATQCGVLSYTVENSEGFPEYKVAYDGNIIFQNGGNPVEVNQYGYPYIISEKTTPTKMAVAYYFRLEEDYSPDLVLTFGQWSWRTMEMAVADQKWMETATKEEVDEFLANFPECPDKIVISVSQEESLKNITLDEGRVLISPISLRIDMTGKDIRGGDLIETLTIQYNDGTEYPVWGPNLANTVFALGSDNTMDMTYMFNRVIDVDKVAAVVINGVEFMTP